MIARTGNPYPDEQASPASADTSPATSRAADRRARNVARGRAERGFTAFEALLATAILAMISITVSTTLMAGRQQTANAQNTLYASMLARELMEEILRLPYQDPNGYSVMGPDPVESPTDRTTWASQSAYAGYTDGPTGISDLAGNAYPSQFQGYVRSVAMTAVSYTPTGWNRTVSGLLVTVTVTYNGQTLASEDRVIVPD